MVRKKSVTPDPFLDIDPILADAFTAPEVNAVEEEAPAKVSRVVFPDLQEAPVQESYGDSLFQDIPVEVTVELGKASVPLKEVYGLGEGAILELERLVGEPLDLRVNGQLVAQGEVVAVNNNYGLRITNLVSKN